MLRNVFYAVIIASSLALVGCSGSTTPQPEATAISSAPASTTATITIDGEQWTCDNVVGSVAGSTSGRCNDLMDQTFFNHMDHIEMFISGRELTGEVGGENYSPKDLAFVGLIACAAMTDNPNNDTYDEYVSVVRDEPRFASLSDEVFEAKWIEAEKLLCL